MEDETKLKLIENEIVSNVKHQNLNAYEMAVVIDEYLKMQQARNMSLKQIEQKLGISLRVIYKYRSILKVPKQTLDKFKTQLSFEQISNVSYSLKDKSKMEDVLQDAVDNHIDSKQLLYYVAEKNDSKKIGTHVINELFRFHKRLANYAKIIVKLPPEQQKRAREICEDIVLELSKI